MTFVVLAKVAGSFLWLLSGFFLSVEINKYNKSKLTQAEAFIALIKNIRLKIECYAMPIPEILASCDDKIISECGGENADRSSLKSFYETIRLAVDGAGKKAIRDFCMTVGSGYKENEVKVCDTYIEELMSYRSLLSDKLPGTEKMCTTIYVCGFGMLLLILI